MESKPSGASVKKKATMARFIVFLVCIAAVVFLGLQTFVFAERPSKDKVQVRQSSLQDVSSGINRFAIKLYKQLTNQQPEDNLFFSPFSVTMVMAMTHLGAKGDTAQQMLEALELADVPKDDLHSSLKYLSGSIISAESAQYTFQSANKVYFHDRFKVLDSFWHDTKHMYDAQAETVNFSGNSESVRRNINSWVEDHTNRKITDLIPTGVLTALTRLVLVNAVYFKGQWVKQFNSKQTRKSQFHVKDDKTFEVDMMIQKEKFFHGFIKEWQAQALELPYSGSNLKMVILLPDKKDGLPQLEEKLEINALKTLHGQLVNTTVEVHLPKFKPTRDFQLNKVLSEMGMPDLFDENKADLSGINGQRDLYVSHVIHKAFIEVNEEGSEAAAATASVVASRAAVREDQFIADHPFLFFIQDAKSGMILFMGRIKQPELLDTGRDEL